MTEPQQTSPPPETHLPWRLISSLVLMALLVVGGLQNTQSVGVSFLWFSGSWPLILVLLATAIVSIVAYDLFKWWWRRRSTRR